MKSASKKILTIVAVLSAIFLIYYYTDFFYPATKITVTENKSEVLISRLTSKEELETIKTRLKEKGIQFNIESVTFSGNNIKNIAVHLVTPFGAEGSFSTPDMRFTRCFSIVVDNATSFLHIGS